VVLLTGYLSSITAMDVVRWAAVVLWFVLVFPQWPDLASFNGAGHERSRNQQRHQAVGNLVAVRDATARCRQGRMCCAIIGRKTAPGKTHSSNLI